MQRRTGNNPIVVHCRYVSHDPVMMTIDDSSNALFIKLSRRVLNNSITISLSCVKPCSFMGFGAWDKFATTVFAAVLDARQLQCLDAA